MQSAKVRFSLLSAYRCRRLREFKPRRSLRIVFCTPASKAWQVEGLASGAMVPLYSLHVFDRSGRCLFDREWNGPRRDDGSGEHPRPSCSACSTRSARWRTSSRRGAARPTPHHGANGQLRAARLRGAVGLPLRAPRGRGVRGDPRAVLFRLRPALRSRCVVKSPVQDPTAGGRVGSPLFERQRPARRRARRGG